MTRIRIGAWRRVMLLAVALCAVAGLGFGHAGTARAAVTSPPPTNTGAPVTGQLVTPLVIQPGNNYDPEWVNSLGWHWEFLGGATNALANTDQPQGASITPITVTGGWQEYKDTVTGNCVYYNGPPDATGNLDEKTCFTNRPSDLWASATVGTPGDTASWNMYIRDQNPRLCGNTNAPVITGDDLFQGQQLGLECPDLANGGYGNDQLWVWFNIG